MSPAFLPNKSISRIVIQIQFILLTCLVGFVNCQDQCHTENPNNALPSTLNSK